MMLGGCPQAFMRMQDAPAITKAALDESDHLAVEAVDLMMAIVGQEAARMGLACLAIGGVYICGGIFPRVSHCSKPLQCPL